MVGSAVYKLLKKEHQIIECSRKSLDLTSQSEVSKWFKRHKPQVVINAAGKVGGILDNSKCKNEYLYTNNIIGLNLIHSSFKNNVKKFINLGSACIYPRKVKNPIKEEYLLSSELEKTNEAYALAKIAVLKYCEYIMKRYNKEYFSLQPTNLYGENDNFNLNTSHVIPALVKKFYNAKLNKKKIVEVWGSGKVTREFLNVLDLAEAIKICVNNKIKDSIINIGSGEEISIKNLANLIKKISGFSGSLYFNKNYPDGVKKRKLDSSKINKLGWKPKVFLNDGLKKYYNYYTRIKA